MTTCVDCPARLWALCSGGKDSLTTAHVLADEGRLAGLAFLDTGISAPGVKEFVATTAKREGWRFESFPAPEGAYEKYVMRNGFPGPAVHSQIMRHLKGRGIRKFKSAHPGEALASGVRKYESKRRFHSTKDRSVFEGVSVFAPIIDWRTEEVWRYVREHGVEVSPVYATLHISGDCMCGSFANPEEISMIKMFYPVVAERIASLETAIRSEGRIRERYRRWGWGNGNGGFLGPTVTLSRHQVTLEDALCQQCAEAP